jgi:tripartite-type tricarboxylate transporter receptor subunit TctC
MFPHVRYLKNALFGLGLYSTAIFAQQATGVLPAGYPVRPIRVLLGVTAGGGLDTVTRVVMQKLGERLGQSIIVDNRPGASSTIAMSLTASASPDGYTLMGATKTMILNGASNRVPYDVLKTFVPIAEMCTQAYVMVVSPSIPVKSIGDLIRYAKASTSAINYGTAGIGSLQHVGMELFNTMAGINIVHVPYKGGSAALNDLIAGQIQIMPSVTISVVAHIRSGKVRAIAVTGRQR